jgi:hypothetical protein
VITWRTDIENIPKDRYFLVEVLDLEWVYEFRKYHVARWVGDLTNGVLVVGNAFEWDHGRLTGWADFNLPGE